MGIYLIIFILALIIGLFGLRKINLLDVFFFSLLAGVSGFRYGVGTDFYGYIEYFEKIKSGQTLELEKGFIYLNLMIAKLNLGNQVVFLIISILTMLFFYLGLKYFTKNILISKPLFYLIFLIFTYFSSLNGIRQVLATSILFFATKYIIERKLLKFSIWVLVAMQFHFSSIIFFPVYFFAVIDFKKFHLYLILFGSYLISETNILNKILEFIVSNLTFIDIGGYITNYLFSSYNSREVSYGLVFYTNIIVILIFIFFKNRLVKSDQNLLLFNFFYIYIIIGILSLETPFLTRLTYLFSIYMALAIPNFIKLFDKKSSKIIEYFLITMYSLLYLYIIINGFLNPESVNYIPYEYNFNIIK